MKKRTLINWLCLSGILSIVFYLLLDIIGGMNYPGYNPAAQAVSDLTATAAPSFMVANGLSSIHGIFTCLCNALTLMFVGAAGSGNVPKDMFGIFERFSTYSTVAFTGVLGIYGFNKR